MAAKGKTLKAIAAEVADAGLGTMTFQAVSLMLKKLEDRFFEEQQSRIAAHKARQTAQLTHIFGEALSEWERSKLPAEEERVKETVVLAVGGDNVTLPANEITRTTRGRVGDAALLAKAIDALAGIRKIWGLDASPDDPNANQANRPIDPSVAAAALSAANAAETQT
ncbi:hypothetical protein [Singulisphaera sp. PoT]|uniref:hypothetical protein n=1 Tax=Singulisphaera sp. PoT TaxID=3411797 RepID=UPI003BF54F59